MTYIIEKTEKVTVGAAAAEVAVNCRAFLLVNASEAETVYFRESSEDGAGATADNSFALLPGQMMPHPLTARTLSLAASGEGTAVHILYLGEGY